MAKKNKTRKQKILADSKKIEAPKSQEIPSSQSPLAPTNPHTSEYVFRMEQGKKYMKIRPTTIIKSHDYGFLKHDLTKTGILITSIIIAQLVLYFILK